MNFINLIIRSLPLAIVLPGILLLVILIVKKVNATHALLVVSVVTGLSLQSW